MRKSRPVVKRRKRGDKAWTPKDRQREVSFALRAYASLATSADKGAVRDKSKLGG
jgi:dihydroxy-acid dehydratase